MAVAATSAVPSTVVVENSAVATELARASLLMLPTVLPDLTSHATLDTVVLQLVAVVEKSTSRVLSSPSGMLRVVVSMSAIYEPLIVESALMAAILDVAAMLV